MIHAKNYTFSAWNYAVSAKIAQEKYELRVVSKKIMTQISPLCSGKESKQVKYNWYILKPSSYTSSVEVLYVISMYYHCI